MESPQPLAPGEHLDFDGDMTTVRRLSIAEHEYRIKSVADGGERSIVLEDEEIRILAELAGYEVRDP